MKPNSRSAEEAIKQNAVQKKKPKSSTSKEQKSGKTLKQGEEQKKVKQNSIISKQNKLLKEKTNSQSSVYVDLFAAAVLVFGGALACYGLLLCRKMRNVRSERSSSETRKEEVAREFGVLVQFQHFWLWVKRQNHTYRPNRPLTPLEETQSVGALREVSNKVHNAELKLFFEVELGLVLSH